MKLIVESSKEVKYFTEAKSDGTKNLYIEGVFMQSEVPNRNNRIYRKGILENALGNFQKMINEKRALGELGHPPNPQINLDKVSHLITNLRFEGNDIVGKAKLLDTPMGKIAKNFIEEGVQLGVSSRGMGSLKEGKNGIMEVQNDFQLATVDIVADPSAPNAFVQGIYEETEWLYVEGQGFVPMKKQIDEVYKTTKYDKALREEKLLQLMQKFFLSIK